MLRRRTITIAACFASFVAVTSVQSQTVSFTRGTDFLTQGLADFASYGRNLNGTRVTATLSDGRTFTSTWGDVGIDGGGYLRSGVVSEWGSLSGYTEYATDVNYMRVNVALPTSVTLTSLVLNGAPGGTMFDCRFNGTACEQFNSLNAEGTVGSRGAPSFGVAFENSGATNNFSAANVFVQYSNMVGLNGTPPVGDLFEQLTIRFNAPSGAGLSSANSNFYYLADTDNIAVGGSLTPVSTVPEPSTYALMAAGLAGMLVMARRRRVA